MPGGEHACILPNVNLRNAWTFIFGHNNNNSNSNSTQFENLSPPYAIIYFSFFFFDVIIHYIVTHIIIIQMDIICKLQVLYAILGVRVCPHWICASLIFTQSDGHREVAMALHFLLCIWCAMHAHRLFIKCSSNSWVIFFFIQIFNKPVLLWHIFIRLCRQCATHLIWRNI